MGIKIEYDQKPILEFLTNDDTDGTIKRTRTSIRHLAQTSVRNLKQNSPKDTGNYSNGWFSVDSPEGFNIENKNRNTKNGEDLVTLLEFGHGTGTGGYVSPKKHVQPEVDRIIKELDRLARSNFK